MKNNAKCLLYYILPISLCMVMYSCILLPDEKLSMKRVDYTGNQLRTDGYYYNYHQVPESTLVLFLYRNGVLFSTRYYPSFNLDAVEKEMISEYDRRRREKTRWGVFSVFDNRIEYEQWNGGTGGGLPIIKYKGIIENDTTFLITETYFSDSKKTDHKEYVYHFKQFDNKPDSTNNFIK